MPDTTFMPAPRSPVFFRVFATVFLLVMIITTAITFILPESYASTTRIQVEPPNSTGTNVAAYDPYFLQTEFEVIQSQVVLETVIEKLNLNAGWGRKYFAGETLTSAQTLAILKQRLMLAPVRNTKLISITVYSDDRNEAAQIANAIAESYRDYRLANAVKTDPQTPKPALVQIVDRAFPGRVPVRPNKPLNLALGAVAGIFLGLLAGGVAEFFRRQTGTARRN